MITTAHTNRQQERNIGGGIAPQTGVVITSPDTFNSDGLALKWHTGGAVVNEYIVTMGTTKGGDDVYESRTFEGGMTPSAINDYSGTWSVSGLGVSEGWVRLQYRYEDGPFYYVDQFVTFQLDALASTTWDDSQRWNDDGNWNE